MYMKREAILAEIRRERFVPLHGRSSGDDLRHASDHLLRDIGLTRDQLDLLRACRGQPD